MTLTRSGLLQMKEAELRTDVLMLLFRAIGYRDVFHHHGAGEKGKDIVMWLSLPLGRRENYAVVAKAAAISGQASGRGSAAEVLTQINQALGSSYVDPTDLSDQQITRVIVVTTHAIRPEAAESLKAALRGSHRDDVVEVIDGTKLWELLERHTPERTILDQLHRAGGIFENASPHHRVIATLRGDRIQVGVESKHPDADKVEPLEFRGRFVVPQTDEGQAVLEAFESHIKRGTPVTIPGKFIDGFDVAELLRPFWSGPPAEIALQPMVGAEPLDVNVVMTADDGTRFALHRVSLRMVRGGSEEIELEAVDNHGRIRFNVVANRGAKLVQINFTTAASTGSVKQEYDAAHFWDAISRGGRLALINDATGLELFAMPVEPDVRRAPSADWLQVVDSLRFLQDRFQTVIPLPERVRRSDALRAVQTANNIRQGVVEHKAATLSMTLTPKPGVRPNAWREPMQVAVLGEEVATLFGVPLPLGQVLNVAVSVKAADESLARIEQWKAGDPPIDVQLKPCDDNSRFWTAYLKWLTPEQAHEVKRRVPGLDLPAAPAAEQ